MNRIISGRAARRLLPAAAAMLIVDDVLRRM